MQIDQIAHIDLTNSHTLLVWKNFRSDYPDVQRRVLSPWVEEWCAENLTNIPRISARKIITGPDEYYEDVFAIFDSVGEATLFQIKYSEYIG